MGRHGKRGLLAGIAVLLTVGSGVVYQCAAPVQKAPIKVGVLHSMSGTMAISERSVVDGELMAIDEINARGGVLGRKLEPVIADGRSDWPTFAAQARRLIVDEKVAVTFGCWTSASRRTVVPVLERHDHLMFYPVQYEGVESSRSVVYVGAAPNQQLIPAVKWFMDHHGPRFFLVGSDYVFPRTANAIARDQLTYLGGKVVGEAYVLLGAKDMRQVVAQIKRAKPDVVLNTINGDSNVAFFKAMREAGIRPNDVPTVSSSIAEDELRLMDRRYLAGNYAAWNYFQSIDTRANRDFVRRFKKRYGRHRVTDDPIASAYMGVHLWARAVERAGTTRVDAVRRALPYQSFDGPEGRVFLDPSNQHTWRATRIGRIRSDGEFDIVWTSDALVHPVPYPVYRTKSEWRTLLREMNLSWGGAWANPGTRITT